MKKRLNKIFFTLLTAAILAVCLLSGCSTTYSSSFNWVMKTIKENYYEDIPEDTLYQSILSGGVSSVLDIYSAYYTEDQYAQVKASNSGSRSGIGITYQFIPEGVTELGSGVYITDVSGNSPALKSGLKAGTFVNAVRVGSEEKVITSSADFSAFIQARDTGEKFSFITDRGEYEMSKENYTASYCTMSTSEKTFSIAYENGNMKLVSSVSENAGYLSDGIDCLPDGAAYIKLDQFYGNAVKEFAVLMAQYNAEHCSSLILDLRQNGGGAVDIMCGISGIFTGQSEKYSGVGMSAKYRNGRQINFKISKSNDQSYLFPAGSKLSVLADNGTASASEALIGVLKSYDVISCADVYISDFSQGYLTFTGTADKNCKTYGKGIMQTTFENRSTGEALKLTTAKIYWPDGTCIHGEGLNGDMGCKTLKTDWCVTYGDEQLALAVQSIYG